MCDVNKCAGCAGRGGGLVEGEWLGGVVPPRNPLTVEVCEVPSDLQSSANFGSRWLEGAREIFPPALPDVWPVVTSGLG